VEFPLTAYYKRYFVPSPYYKSSCLFSDRSFGPCCWLWKSKWRDNFMIMNLWVTGWGDGGYFKMARNAGNICRVADYVIFHKSEDKFSLCLGLCIY